MKSVSEKREYQGTLLGEGGGNMIPVWGMLIFRHLCDFQADVKETTEYDSLECKEAWAGRYPQIIHVVLNAMGCLTI